MNRVRTSRKRTTAALAIAMAGSMMAATPAASGMSAGQAIRGLDGPRGVAMGPGGKLVVTEADGSYSRIVRTGPRAGKVVKIGRVPHRFAPAVDINDRGQIFLLSGEGKGRGAAKLFRYTPGKGRKMIGDIGKYQRRDPDPFNLAESPKQSNPFGVAALDDGSALVADAANNDLLRVYPDGDIVTVARVKPRTVRAPDLGEEGPPAGTKVPTEAVVTSVTVGADGAYYIGELRGFPGNPRKSHIWAVKRGWNDAVCNPRKPRTGDCKRYADGLTSIMDLAAGRDGSIYAVELSKMGWLATESPNPVPRAEIGSLIRVNRAREIRRELAKGKLKMPGGVEIGRSGGVFVTTPIFGPGVLRRVR